MRIGIFADTHDHLDNIRLAVAEFNRRECELVVFAGDLVSTFAIPPLRKLNCRMIASFGDNEGNKVGVRGGMQIIGEIGDPPFCFRLADGKRVLLTHQRGLIREPVDDIDIIIYSHTHKPRIHREESGRLWINPGETSGWTYGRPTIVALETDSMDAQIVDLLKPESPA
ncbi:MAG: YfcE family phosphodiesterase [Planctomycetaceae bacterium]|nr:YfcE family phosphodiesterase [Planctomycetaceae bacterium]